MKKEPEDHRHLSTGLNSEAEHEPQQHLVEDEEPHPFFDCMAKYPLPFILFLPILFIVISFLGMQVEEKVEEKVENIWIAEDGEYAADQSYARSLGTAEDGSGSIAMMAISRDSKNLLTASRLAAVNKRMEEMEAVRVSTLAAWNEVSWQMSHVTPLLQVEVDGVTWMWDDFCGISQRPYEFPCSRLTAMDLYKETGWAFKESDKITWFQFVVREKILNPRLPRFGMLVSECEDECGTIVEKRADEPFKLFSDVDDLEMNHECRECFERESPKRMIKLHKEFVQTMNIMREELKKVAAQTNDQTIKAKANDMSNKCGQLADSVTQHEIQDFYSYYVIRGLYEKLGSTDIQTAYKKYKPIVDKCKELKKGGLEVSCPDKVGYDTASDWVYKHVDSPVAKGTNFLGSYLPFWNEEGVMFGPGKLGPIYGIGMNFSGDNDSFMHYMDLGNYSTSEWNPKFKSNKDGLIDLDDPVFVDMIIHSPMWQWFMAGLTPAEPGSGKPFMCKVIRCKQSLRHSLTHRLFGLQCAAMRTSLGRSRATPNSMLWRLKLLKSSL